MAAATVLSLFMIGFYEVRADDPVKGRIPALPPFQLALVDNPPPPQSIPTAPISPIPALITKPVVTQIPPPDPLAWTQAGADSNAPQRHSRRIAAGFLHASGTQIVDSLGESVLLKGVNTGAWLLRDPFWYDGGIALEGSWDQGADDQNLLIENGIKSVLQGDVEAKYRQIQTLFRNNFITKPDIDDLSRFGFNCVRVPIDYRLFSRMPVGGLCAGQLYLGGDGKLWLWDIFNRSTAGKGTNYGGRGFGNSDGSTYFSPWTQKSPLAQGFAIKYQVGSVSGQRTLDMNGGWPVITFEGKYSVGVVNFKDPGVPLTIKLEGFSPFIPLNSDLIVPTFRASNPV